MTFRSFFDILKSPVVWPKGRWRYCSELFLCWTSLTQQHCIVTQWKTPVVKSLRNPLPQWGETSVVMFLSSSLKASSLLRLLLIQRESVLERSVLSAFLSMTSGLQARLQSLPQSPRRCCGSRSRVMPQSCAAHSLRGCVHSGSYSLQLPGRYTPLLRQNCPKPALEQLLLQSCVRPTTEETQLNVSSPQFCQILPHCPDSQGTGLGSNTQTQKDSDKYRCPPPAPPCCCYFEAFVRLLTMKKRGRWLRSTGNCRSLLLKTEPAQAQVGLPLWTRHSYGDA